MPSPDELDDLFSALKRLAAEDIREARKRFCELLDGDADRLNGILTRASKPGEGRLRHLVANAVQNRDDRHLLAEHLSAWLEIETDEFSKRAIAIALRGMKPATKRAKTNASFVDPSFVEIYRYVADRLSHEIRNAMMEHWTHIRRVESAINSIAAIEVRSELAALAAGLRASLDDVNRIVQFDANDEYFAPRSLILCNWINTMTQEYCLKYKRFELSIEGDQTAILARINGSDYLLKIIFWNLWTNSIQAVTGPCKVTIHAKIKGRNITLLLVDNGIGFSEKMVDVAFRERFSTSGPSRGRGLLEVQDAVERLHGSVELIRCETTADAFRVKISFPVETL